MLLGGICRDIIPNKKRHIVIWFIQIQINWPYSDCIKIDTFWMSWFKFQKNFCNLSLVLRDRLHLALFKKIWWFSSCHIVKCSSYFDEIRATLRELRKIVVSYQMWKSIKDPNFLKKCQMQPISQDQWQIAKIFLEFKFGHSKCVDFVVSELGQLICIYISYSTIWLGLRSKCKFPMSKWLAEFNRCVSFHISPGPWLFQVLMMQNVLDGHMADLNSRQPAWLALLGLRSKCEFLMSNWLAEFNRCVSLHEAPDPWILLN